MRVGIFVEVVKAKNQTGISRYVKRLVENMVAQNDGTFTFYLYYQNKIGEQKLDWLRNDKYVKHRALITPVDLLSEHPRIWWHYYLPAMLKWDRIDLFHGPNHYIPLKGSVPSILTIHDIAYFYMTVHGQGMDTLMKASTLQNLNAATHVVAVSESTARDLVKQGAESSNISVIYQGYEPNPNTQLQVETIGDIRLSEIAPYLLFVGTIQPRKNVTYMVTEFAKVANEIEHNLVLAGAPGESYDEVVKLIDKYNLQSRIYLTGFISDEERHSLYSRAFAFLYPSLYEGFGLVILEAMSYGIPVITGNNSSLPEAAGDAGMLIDCAAEGALAGSILKLVQNDELRREMITKGNKHKDSFNWHDSAKAMMDLYVDIGGSGNL